MEYKDLIVLMPWIVISILYIIGITAAVISYRKYRFSALLFIPIALLWPVPYFIFPVFAYAEYRKTRVQTADSRSQRLLRLKRDISWIPAIGALVIHRYLYTVFAFDMEISPKMLNLVCTHGIVLIITIFILWLNTRLTKIANDVP